MNAIILNYRTGNHGLGPVGPVWEAEFEGERRGEHEAYRRGLAFSGVGPTPEAAIGFLVMAYRDRFPLDVRLESARDESFAELQRN